MKLLTAATLLALTTFVSGCGAEDPTTTGPPASPSEQSPSEEASAGAGAGDRDSDKEGDSAGDGDGDASNSPSPEAPSPAGKQVLIGTVGNPDEPEAFVIGLTDRSGKPVDTLPAGEYQVKVTDPATFHNFHLTGPGVDEATSVSSTGKVTWTVTLKPGSYTFICDPHPHMKGKVTVT